jgi:cyclase
MSEDKLNMFFGADVILFENAKKLRDNMTWAERKLFEQLSCNKLKARFKAQHPIFIYVVDFYCHKAKLVIEIDGDVHFNKEAQLKDIERTKTLEGFGLRIIRFTNEQIHKDMDGVLKEIKSYISPLD